MNVLRKLALSAWPALCVVAGALALIHCDGTSTGNPLADKPRAGVKVVLPSGAEVWKSPLALADAPYVMGDVETLGAGSRSFAFDLLAVLGSDDKNVFFSPYSVQTALAMTYAAARGTTAAQMRTRCTSSSTTRGSTPR